MFSKGIQIYLAVFFIVLSSSTFVEAKKVHIQHHNTTTQTSPITTIDEDSPEEPVKIKRIHFLHRSHKQNFVSTTLSPAAIDDQEVKNEEATTTESSKTKTHLKKTPHRLIKKHMKNHGKKHKIPINETILLNETTIRNETIVQINNGTNQTTTTKISSILFI